MAVLDPVKVVITNFPEDHVELLDAVNNPEDESAGTRKVPFTRELFIERADFMEDPPRKFFRLGPGREVRFRWAYFLTCNDFIKDAEGNIVEIHCTYDPETRGGDSPDGRKVKGTIHWVSADQSIPAQIRLYDRLFTEEKPDSHKDTSFTEFLNPDSLQTIDARIEPHLAEVTSPGYQCQFERTGYFVQTRTPLQALLYSIERFLCVTVGLRKKLANLNTSKSNWPITNTVFPRSYSVLFSLTIRFEPCD